MSSVDDSSILSDPLAFEKFFKDKYRMFCHLALRYTNNDTVAEEIVQEVLVKVWERRDQIDVKGSLTAYIALSVKNTCINYLKHQQIITNFEKNELIHASIETYAENFPDNTELEAMIFDAIDKLPPKRKQIFLLSRIDGLKYHEIASKLNLSVKTVEAQMGIALKQLRVMLKDYLP